MCKWLIILNPDSIGIIAICNHICKLTVYIYNTQLLNSVPVSQLVLNKRTR